MQWFKPLLHCNVTVGINIIYGHKIIYGLYYHLKTSILTQEQSWNTVTEFDPQTQATVMQRKKRSSNTGANAKLEFI